MGPEPQNTVQKIAEIIQKKIESHVKSSKSELIDRFSKQNDLLWARIEEQTAIIEGLQADIKKIQKGLVWIEAEVYGN